MVFSSIPFLFYFLPLAVIGYYIVPKKLKNGFMIIASLIFFAWGEIRFIPVMLGLSVVDFVCGRFMEKYRDNKKNRRIFMLLSIFMNLGVLIFFKYTNFFVGNINLLFGASIPDPKIILPMGVSFISFQSISYAIDVYRGVTKAEKKYYNYLCYITLFPKIILGPIIRYVTIKKELEDPNISIDNFSLGMRRFLIGLGKKVLIANNIGLLWEQISGGQAGQPTVLLYWLGIIAFTFKIYFDFSGYSDMAIGIAKVFGYTFKENFDFPYISQNITEFWRRWHVSLGLWFRDYIFFPISGSLTKKKWGLTPVYLTASLVVWVLTGFWHGAAWNFIIWGLYFAVLIILEKLVLSRFWEKVPRVIQHIYTMFFVMIGWIIFSADDLVGVTAGQYLSGLFGFGKLPLWDSQAIFYLLQYAVIFILAAYFSTPHFKKVLSRIETTNSKILWSVISAGYLIVFVASIAFIVNGSYKPFLYFRF